MTTTPATGLQLRSTVKKDGTLELSLASVATPSRSRRRSIVRIDASPINPSDQGLLFGGADMSTAKASGTADNPVVTATHPAGGDEGDGRASRPVDARRQRGGRRGRPGGGVAGRPGADRQDGRHRRAAPCTRSTGASRPCSAWCCRRGPRRPRAPPASSTRSPRSAWSPPCARRATRRWCTPRPPPTSARCSTRSASRTTSRLVNIVRKRRARGRS